MTPPPDLATHHGTEDKQWYLSHFSYLDLK
jgi:hypothetical protein